MQIRRVGNTPQLLPKREIRHGRGAEGAGLPAGSVPRFVRLNPELDVNQYAHNAWTIRDGFFNGPVRTIAQTPDGYLWLGTELGLLRFDGVRCVQWQAPGDERLPSSNVRRLLASRDGRLWIGTDSGLVNWKGINLTVRRICGAKSEWALGGSGRSDLGRHCRAYRETLQSPKRGGPVLWRRWHLRRISGTFI